MFRNIGRIAGTPLSLDSTNPPSAEAVFLVAELAFVVSSRCPTVTSQRSRLDEHFEHPKLLPSNRVSDAVRSYKTIFKVFWGSDTHYDRIACNRDLICA